MHRTMSIRRSAAAAAIDPVCGMAVDPATNPASPRLSSITPIISARPAAAANLPPIRRNISSPAPRREPAMRGRHDLHLPDASRSPAGRPGRLPDLRHGARTRHRHGRSAGQSRTARHDAAVLDRARTDAAGGRAGNGRPFCRPRRLADAKCRQRHPTGVGDSGRALGRLAVFRARLAFVRVPATSICSRSSPSAPASLGLTASSRRWRRNFSRRLFAATKGRSPFISRRRRESRCWCCSARCWSCAPGSAPPARSARSSISHRKPRAGSTTDGAETEVALDAVLVGDRLRVRPGEKIPVDGTVDRRPLRRSTSRW